MYTFRYRDYPNIYFQEAFDQYLSKHLSNYNGVYFGKSHFTIFIFPDEKIDFHILLKNYIAPSSIILYISNCYV